MWLWIDDVWTHTSGPEDGDDESWADSASTQDDNLDIPTE